MAQHVISIREILPIALTMAKRTESTKLALLAMLSAITFVSKSGGPTCNFRYANNHAF